MDDRERTNGGSGRPWEMQWPPPGLEGMAGRLRPAAGLAGLGGALLALPMAVAIDLGGSATLDADSAVAGGLAVATLAALGLLLAGGAWLTRLCWRAGRAFGGGYTLETVLEVLVDPRGDTAAVIAGRREYAGLDPSVRSAIRRWRLGSGLALLVAALLPVPTLVLVVVMGGRFGIPAPATAAVLGPSVFLLSAAGFYRMREWQRVSRARAARRRERRAALAAGELSRAWYRRVGQAPGGAPPVGRPRWGPWLPWAAGVGGVACGLALLALLLPLFVVWGFGGSFALEHDAPPERYREAMILVDLGRPYRLPVDTSVSAEEAGRLFYELASGRHPGPPVIAEGCVDPFYGDATRAGLVSAFDRDRLDFTRTELDCLATLEGHPIWPMVSRLAGAGRMDLGPRLEGPGGLTGPGGVLLPLPTWSIRKVAHAAVALSALDASRGGFERAERRLREVASLALLLVDHPTSTLEEMIGAVMVEAATDALEELYRRSGRAAALARLETRRDSLRAVVQERRRRAATSGSTPDRTGPHGRRAGLLDRMTDPTENRGLRWDRVRGVQLLRCTNVGEYLLGLDRDARRALETARRQLGRYPSERAYFDALVRDGLGEDADEEARRLLDQAGIPPPPVADLGLLRWPERVLGVPSLGTCLMLVDMTNAVL